MVFFRSAVFNLLFYGLTALMAIGGLPLLLGSWRVVAAYSRLWVDASLALLRWTVGIDYQVVGRERLPPGPAIFAIKHQSAWDTLAFNRILPNAAYVLKQELTYIPFYGWYLWGAGMIGIDRAAGPKALRRIVRRSQAVLDTGRSVIIFPEGTRTAPGTSVPYHPGVAALYRHLDAPVVPVALNSGLFWGRRRFLKRPGRITVSFLEPIPPGLDRDAFMAELQSRIEGECARINAAAMAEIENPT
ncbi:MAG: lysophospholipid acyltransferase family protein [Alphaproteobacteria bacterium]|nr:lysophospholipid acyltransferase family protein [Alphaproteobacteria bacterium]